MKNFLIGFCLIFYTVQCVEINTKGLKQNQKNHNITGSKLSGKNLQDVKKLTFVKYYNDQQINTVDDFPLLQEIRIDFMDQENIPLFKNVPLLRSISIQGNKVLIIKNNTLRSTNVKSLQLSYNEILDIQPRSFGKKVDSLVLNCNKLKNFDVKWFQSPEKLTFLSIAGNEISYLQNKAFDKFIALDYIYLGLNKIQHMGSRVFNKIDIADISLYGNELSEIKHSTFPITTHIGHLDIQYNKLNYLPSTFLGNISVDEFYFLSNPWLCTCYYQKIIKWPNWKNFDKWVGVEQFKGKSDTPSCVQSLNPTDYCKEEVDEEATEYYHQQADLKFINSEQTCDIWKEQALVDAAKKKYGE